MSESARARIRERLLQDRTARQILADTELSTPPCAEGRLGCTFLAGERAFDRVSGQFVEVVSGTVETVVVPVAKR